MADDEIARSAAQAQIQSCLTEMKRILESEVLPLARQHRIEFSFMGLQYHLYPRGNSVSDPGEVEIYSESKNEYRYEERQPAQEGMLIHDEEWYSSTFGCSGRYWKWHEKNWPERNEP